MSSDWEIITMFGIGAIMITVLLCSVMYIEYGLRSQLIENAIKCIEMKHKPAECRLVFEE